jgi:HK97 family phage major capsid protein
VYKDGASFAEFLTNYTKAFNAKDPDVAKQVEEQTQQTLAAFLKEHYADLRRPDMRAAADAVRNSRQTGAEYMPTAPGTPLNGKFATLTDFANAIDGKFDVRNPEGPQQREVLRNAMSSSDPGSGGFLVPEEFRSELLQVALETAIVRPRARVIPMNTLRAAIPMVDTTTNSGSIFGGVIAYWTEEGAALVQSQPRFARVVLEAKKLTAYTEVPNELRMDSSPSVEAILRSMFPEAIAWFEDIAFLTGTGVGEPLGIFNALNNAILAVTKEAGQLTGTIVWENIVNMYARMLPSSLGSAVWIVSPDTLPQLMTTALTVGTGGAPIGMANFNGQSGPTLSLLGRPVIVSEKVPSLTNQGDISFVDFRQYLIGDRMAMSAETSTEFKFGNDVTAYRFIERVDGRPWMQSAITPKNGGNTLSAYVQLGAR